MTELKDEKATRYDTGFCRPGHRTDDTRVFRLFVPSPSFQR